MPYVNCSGVHRFLAVYKSVYGSRARCRYRMCIVYRILQVKGFPMAAMERLRLQLKDPSTSISKKHRILFALKNMDTPEAHAIMLLGLKDPSVLFRHEVAYCLGIDTSFKLTSLMEDTGQTQKTEGIAELVRILDDMDEHPMVRHEAGEALGAIGDDACILPLKKHINDVAPEVQETCLLALRRIADLQKAKTVHTSSYITVDPAPAAIGTESLNDLEGLLLDEGKEMFDRYRALFALRNMGGSEAVRSIARAFSCSSALLKHEVAFVLGQMQHPEAIDALRSALRNTNANPMVRHEAAEALGSIAEDACIELLQQHSCDPEPIVAESCLVALDMVNHERSDAFEYVAVD